MFQGAVKMKMVIKIKTLLKILKGKMKGVDGEKEILPETISKIKTNL